MPTATAKKPARPADIVWESGKLPKMTAKQKAAALAAPAVPDADSPEITSSEGFFIGAPWSIPASDVVVHLARQGKRVIASTVINGQRLAGAGATVADAGAALFSQVSEAR